MFDKAGICNEAVLRSQIGKFTVVRGEGPVETIEFIKDANPNHIKRAVKRAGVFDFSVGNVAIDDKHFMESLVNHLEQQRRVAAKAH